MLSEDFISAINGPPLSSNTAVAKHVGLYTHALNPTFGVKSTFKNSSAPANCVAVNDTHVFAAQQDSIYVHVYSRLRGNHEAFVSFPESIQCLTLGDSVLILGTAEGRLMLWETATGRLVSTPPRHVQGVSCVVATPHHVLTGSDDSDVHVWSLVQLLELGSHNHQPELTLSNHRTGITALASSHGSNPETSFCVSASKDKSCIIWNYASGEVLRTLLFPSFPRCVALDPASRALFVSTDDGSIYVAEFFAEKALLGPSAEDASTVVQLSSPFGCAPPDAGPASCLSVSYDGTVLLTGHAKGQILKWDVAENKTPVELANLNAAVTNVMFVPPLPARRRLTCPTVVKPSQGARNYTLTAQFEDTVPEAVPETRFHSMLTATGFPPEVLEEAVSAAQQPAAAQTASEQELRFQNDELWDLIHEQREIQKQLYQRLAQAQDS